MNPVASYQALALQTRCRAVNACTGVLEARELLRANIDRLAKMIPANMAFIGPACKLVVLPEYVLTGFPLGESFSQWREKACISVDSPEMESLCRIAQDNKVYLAVNAYEKEKHFPELFFQGCFLISPEGRLVLHYRRMNSVFSPTPFDVWNKYLEVYGEDALFPVADTPLGRMAFVASDEILFPEVSRMALMKGTEILLHPTSETHSPLTSGKDVCKQARAVENLAYVISANTAGIEGTPVCAESADGGSRIVDYRGRILAMAGTGESLNAFAEIHIANLREARRQTGMQNLVARQRYGQYAEFYQRAEGVPVNALSGVNDPGLKPAGESQPDFGSRMTQPGEAQPGRAQLLALQRETISRLEKKGVLP